MQTAPNHTTPAPVMHYLDHYATTRGRYALTLLLSLGSLLTAGLAIALLTAGCKTATLGEVITPARVETVTALGAFYGAKEAIAKGHRPELERARAGLAAMADAAPKDWTAIAAALDAAGLTWLESGEGSLAIQAAAAIFSDEYGPDKVLDTTYGRAVVRGALRGITLALDAQANTSRALPPESQLKAEAAATRP